MSQNATFGIRNQPQKKLFSQKITKFTSFTTEGKIKATSTIQYTSINYKIWHNNIDLNFQAEFNDPTPTTPNKIRIKQSCKKTMRQEYKPSKTSVKQLLGQLAAFLHSWRLLNVLLVLLQQLFVICRAMLGNKLRSLASL